MTDLKTLAMVLDVESVGVQGQGFAYGYVVINLATGKLCDARRRWCDPAYARGTQEGHDWVTKHVPMLEPRGFKGEDDERLLPPARAFQRQWSEWFARVGVAGAMSSSGQVRSTFEVRLDFWTQWERWRDRVDLWADVGWPVESRFLAECVDDGRDGKRDMEGPYPLLDVETALRVIPSARREKEPGLVYPFPGDRFLAATGETWNGGMLDHVVRHDPLSDSYVSARRLYHGLRLLGEAMP